MPRFVRIGVFDGCENGSAQGRLVVKSLLVTMPVLTHIILSIELLRYLAGRAHYGVYSGY
jgi:hypothetical protein